MLFLEVWFHGSLVPKSLFALKWTFSARHGKSAVRWTGLDGPSGPDNGQKTQVQSRLHSGGREVIPFPGLGAGGKVVG